MFSYNLANLKFLLFTYCCNLTIYSAINVNYIVFLRNDTSRCLQYYNILWLMLILQILKYVASVLYFGKQEFV